MVIKVGQRLHKSAAPDVAIQVQSRNLKPDFLTIPVDFYQINSLDLNIFTFRNPNTTSCIVNFIEDKLGCSPNIIGSNTRSPKAPCRSSDQLTEMARLSRWLDEADDTAIYEMTGDGYLESTSPALDKFN